MNLEKSDVLNDKAGGDEQELIFDSQTGRFFRKIDWMALAICFLISFTVYFFTLAPTVTLEDSGELAVASDYLGVPHPPGYPIWTLVTWFFQWIFDGVSYNGHPNPAWGVALSSGFFGALACGLLAMLISRSGSDMLRDVKKMRSVLGLEKESWICLVSGVSGGLLLAFSPVLWSQSTIVEVYSLNAFFMMLVVLFLYIWMCRPSEMKWLYALAFSFGLGLTNHQTLIFMGMPLVIAVVLKGIKSRDGLYLMRDFIIVGIVMFAMLLSSSLAGQYKHPSLNWSEGPAHPGFWLWTSLMVLFPALVAMPKEWRKGVSFSICGILGLFIFSSINVLNDKSGEVHLWGGGLAHPVFWVWTVFALLLVLVPFFLNRKMRVYALGVAFIVLFIAVQKWAKLAGFNDLQIDPADGGGVGFALWFVVSAIFWALMFFDVPKGKEVGITFLLIELGVSFYLLMPFASEQNPPINWAYPRTWQGFMHAVTRGQYEKIDPAANFSKIVKDMSHFSEQNLRIIFDMKGCISVVAQFTAYISVLALVPFFFFGSINRKTREWLIVTVVAFIFMTVVFIIFQYPSLDLQTLFIGRVQYIQAHAIFALWIAYGAIFALAWLDTLLKGEKMALFTGLLVVSLFPLIPVFRNAYDKELRKIGGSSDQQGHDFGWQFGYYQLRGVNGILEELTPEERLSYPDPSYPPEMGTNAVFFGGTDPGRFVPTYMIYSAKVRSDVYLITQNALADATYLNVMRDLYGEDIMIPSVRDSNQAFAQYINDVETGKIRAGADVKKENGRVSVQGVGGVMQINSILARMIFEDNKYTQSPEIMERFKRGESLDELGVRVMDVGGEKRPVREFYVEESYAIPWMYPYLEPHGLIMKINPEPVPLSKELVAKDHAFWEWYVDRLSNNKAFVRDTVARKTFSKLRSSIAGLYVARGMHTEAVHAFKQAVDLYPLSPEANFRLADVLMRQGKDEEAREVIKAFQKSDPENKKTDDFLKVMNKMSKVKKRLVAIEAKRKRGDELTSMEIMELTELYLVRRDMGRFNLFARQVLDDDNMPPELYIKIAALCARARRIDLLEYAFERYTVRMPENYSGWVELGGVQAALGKKSAALASVRKAVECGGEPARVTIRKNVNFKNLWKDPVFQKLVPPQPQRNVMPGGSIPTEIRRLLQ